MVTRSHIQELQYILWSCIKKLYSTDILATFKSKLTAKRRELYNSFVVETPRKFVYLSSLSNADICDGEDYCYFIINNHLPRAKCYRSTFTIIMQ